MKPFTLAEIIIGIISLIVFVGLLYYRVKEIKKKEIVAITKLSKIYRKE